MSIFFRKNRKNFFTNLNFHLHKINYNNTKRQYADLSLHKPINCLIYFHLLSWTYVNILDTKS